MSKIYTRQKPLVVFVARKCTLLVHILFSSYYISGMKWKQEIFHHQKTKAVTPAYIGEENFLSRYKTKWSLMLILFHYYYYYNYFVNNSPRNLLRKAIRAFIVSFAFLSNQAMTIHFLITICFACSMGEMEVSFVYR